MFACVTKCCTLLRTSKKHIHLFETTQHTKLTYTRIVTVSSVVASNAEDILRGGVSIQCARSCIFLRCFLSIFLLFFFNILMERKRDRERKREGAGDPRYSFEYGTYNFAFPRQSPWPPRYILLRRPSVSYYFLSGPRRKRNRKRILSGSALRYRICLLSPDIWLNLHG